MSVKIRDFKYSDIDAIDRIFNKQPELGVPSLENKLINFTIENDGKVIGYVVIKLFSEITMILDHGESKRIRVEALKKSMEVADKKLKNGKVEYLYAVINNKSFGKILKNHYGFRTVPGELLFLDLKEDQR